MTEARKSGPRRIVSTVALMLCWSGSACTGSTTDVPENIASREAFIGSYLDLRIAAVDAGSSLIGDQVRDSILTVHGVTEQDLRNFVDVHGDDIQFMHDLWVEVETRLSDYVERRRDEDADEALQPERGGPGRNGPNRSGPDRNGGGGGGV